MSGKKVYAIASLLRSGDALEKRPLQPRQMTDNTQAGFLNVCMTPRLIAPPKGRVRRA
jgi:hypothetical protein